MGIVLFGVWLLALEFNVSIYALQTHVPCDRPLAVYLLVAGCMTVLSIVLQLILLFW